MTEMEQLGSNTGILIELGGNVKGTKKTSKKWSEGLMLWEERQRFSWEAKAEYPWERP